MKHFHISALAAVTLVTFSQGAFASERERHHSPNLPDLKEHHRSLETKCPSHSKHTGSPTLPQRLECGDLITADTVLGNDLFCPDTTGSVIYVIGDNITFDGRGHRIIAPQAGSGIFVQGNNVSVKNIQANGITNGSGIFAYDSPSLSISRSDFSNNQTGIILYAEKTVMSDVAIAGNTANHNSYFGIRSGRDGIGMIESPKIQRNDFSYSGSYAMHLGADHLELDKNSKNSFTNSTNGIYLVHGNFYLHDFSIAKELLKEIGIFVDSATYFKAHNMDVSTSSPADVNQRRVGLDLYRVAEFQIDGLIAKNNDAGLKFENELGTSPTGSVTYCQFSNHVVAGIMVEAYDESPYGNLNFTRNCFNEPLSAFNIWVTPNTTIGEMSLLETLGIQVCSLDRDRDDDDRSDSSRGDENHR